jgi:putative transposase
VNRKRVQLLMREHRVLRRRRSEGGRRRPGYFRVERPDQLWHMDITGVWVAEHGWCYVNAAIDCCTREITGWALDIRCRAPEAVAVIDTAAAERGIAPGRLMLGTDDGSAFTSRAFCKRLTSPRTRAQSDPRSLFAGLSAPAPPGPSSGSDSPNTRAPDVSGCGARN